MTRFINLESGLVVKTFRLDRVEILAEMAGHPERCAPCIHIAGSKGKGSVTGMLASMLEADGRRAARYMSPHVSDFRERLGMGGGFFDEAVYCAAGDELRELIDEIIPAAKHPLFDPSSSDGEPPTFFEMLTLLFFLCARRAECDAMVVETGMGGRLDATNIVDPLVSVITLIELEHTAFLGNTLAAVAGEKAGIIKPKRPLVLAKQAPEALAIFKQRAAEQNSPLFYFPQTVDVSNITIHRGGTDFTLNCMSPPSPPLKLFVPVPGAIQAENAGLAALALVTAFPGTAEESIRRGLERFHIPARFELISADPPFIIDGAHTPESAALCADTFCPLYGEGGILLFGCAADKNAAGMAEALLPRFSKIIITTPGTFKASDPAKVFDAFCAAQKKQQADKVTLVRETPAAIKLAHDHSRALGLPVLSAGSFYLAAEVRTFFGKR